MASNKIKIGQYNVLQTLGVGSFGKVKSKFLLKYAEIAFIYNPKREQNSITGPFFFLNL